MFRSGQPRTYFTPAPLYSVEGLSHSDAKMYNKGWTEAMEAVQQGVVWIDGRAREFALFVPSGG